MVSLSTFRKKAMAFHEVIELPHFDRTSFRVNNKIFATLAEKEMLATLKLSLVNQSVFVDIGKGAVFPVPGAWGKKGYTSFNLNTVNASLLYDALSCAYNLTIQKK